jgi:uncharacterized surface protein with fasciclin (FAS1) repeats
MKQILLRSAALFFALSVFFTACKKGPDADNTSTANEEAALRSEARQAITDKTNTASSGEAEIGRLIADNTAAARGQNRNIVQIASSVPIFKSLVAAVVKTGLAGVLASPELNATVFAPTDAAFAKLPAPFNNATNINGISDAAQIAALKSILLYHVLGTEVKKHQVARGRSSAVTLKPAGTANDNTIYFSNNFGLLVVNGNSLVLFADVDASNGVIHVIDDVLLPPSQNIAQIAIGNPAFSSLVAALVKTNLAGVFTGSGDFTVFAPTDAAFAKLPAPFNNAANISAITDAAQIAALANILKYHVTGSRYFAWDLGIFQPVATLAAAPNNNLVTILGLNGGYVKGNSNPNFATIRPANILATNGVIQVVNKVLLP